MKIGYAGMGIMGRGMAANLVQAGYDVTVWNRTPERTEELASVGASVAGSPAELAAACDIVMICVSDTPDVVEVTMGEQGLIHSLGPGRLVVDPVSYTHLTLPTTLPRCRSRWSPDQ